METVTSPNAWFVTLTYNDEHIPYTAQGFPTLRKKQARDWAANHLSREGIRYYLVGEYGEKSLRPHYHLAVFLQPGKDISTVTGKWKRGFTSAYPMSPGTAQYLAQYTVKKLVSDTDERLEAHQEPEFRTSSTRPPLGAAFVSLVVRSFSDHGAAALIEREGDVPRSWRYGEKILPMSDWCLRQLRVHFDVPLLHRERLQHPGYFARHSTKESAEWDPEAATAMRIQYDAKKKALRLRTNAQPI